MTTSLRLWALFACLLSLAPGMVAQGVAEPAIASSGRQEGFTAEPYVIESYATVTDLKADGTGTAQQTIRVKVQSEAALRQFGVVAVSFENLSQTAAFGYARVHHADGTVVDTAISSAMEQPAPATREAPTYSDLYTRELPIKDLRVGDVLEWQTLVTTTKPDVPGQVFGQAWFLTGAVVLHEAHELRYPAAMSITVWTNPSLATSASTTVEGAERVARWHHEELHPTVGAAADAARRTEERRMLTAGEELDATRGKLPSLAWSTFPDWAAVGAWYRGLMAERATPDAAVRAKVAELTAGKTTELARAQTIYAYVSRIHYVGVSFGVGRLQPHTAAEVLANQYGDCKDKHVLLAAMLSAAGVSADPVLIGAGIRFNPAVPSPSAFNHLITRARVDGEQMWLDTTAEVAPWRALLPGIRDREGLEIPSTGPAVIVRTPEYLPYPATASWVVKGSLDDLLTSRSQFVLTYRDDVEIGLRAVLRNVSAAQYGALVQQLMAGQGFGGTTSAAVVEHLDDNAQPLVISFTYERLKEKDWGEDRITVPFSSLGVPSFAPDKPPTSPIRLDMPQTFKSTVELTLPPGWSAELPPTVHAVSAFATCDVSYRTDIGKLFAERRLVVLQPKVPVAEFTAYQTWYESCGAGGVPYVQLKPSAAAAMLAAGGDGSPAGATDEAAGALTPAATLVAQARKIMLGKDPVDDAASPGPGAGAEPE